MELASQGCVGNEQIHAVNLFHYIRDVFDPGQFNIADDSTATNPHSSGNFPTEPPRHARCFTARTKPKPGLLSGQIHRLTPKSSTGTRSEDGQFSRPPGGPEGEHLRDGQDSKGTETKLNPGDLGLLFASLYSVP
ncbi:hypothetical protein N7462_006942 [Penicillium macrosclerotiorum]|uniref:uncharacterized protein n=1 Tax=Penicillium macrosclerotiorum TaxID=303699 RepID=UPI0025487D87|nr:uncharacterized protein N7462_006942 [Penicillium macrosclerotiorum]KAJ5678698.1 hypothetical protein N7462_006942 [Penicillium macrosclerotiorum]